MKLMRFLFLLVSLSSGLVAEATSQVNQQSQPVLELSRYIVDDYRKLIVLFSDEQEVHADETERNEIIGKILYHEKLDRLNQLRALLFSEIEKNNQTRAKTLPLNQKFLDIVENSSELWDADKLVFLSLLESLNKQLYQYKQGSSAAMKLQERIFSDLNVLNKIQQRYDNELGQIFSNIDTRAMRDRRQAWHSYVSHLRTSYNKQQIIAEHGDLGLYSSSRSKKDKNTKNKKKKRRPREISGRGLAKKTLLLTFDDGPHPKYTEQIRKILDKYNIKPIFFHVGKNLGRVDAKGNIKLNGTSKSSKKLLQSGATLANHSYSHPVLSKLELAKIKKEISTTNLLLKEVSGETPVFFRAPYGARNQKVLAQVNEHALKSMMWNIDSKDWADPVPKSIAKRVVDLVNKEKRGIMLFHDIQPQTVKALPLILDELVKQGYQFAQWDGKSFTTKNNKSKSKEAKVKQDNRALYKNSWAVIVGIDKYQHWPELRYAVNDGKGIEKLLLEQYGFKPQNIFTLYDQQATRKNILSLFHDKLGDPNLVGKNDRVFVFYAGHGTTRRLPSGRDLGYIIPVDAAAERYYGQAVSMTSLSDISEAIAAKHLFFVMDSCYSGLALTRSGPRQKVYNYIRENTKRSARQILTAGGADQEVTDSGPNGHSVFTWTLIQALKGKGDMNKDGFITASELSAYISPIVSSLSLQTPAFGNLLGSGGGDFVFSVHEPSAFLSDLSVQLDEQELVLSRQIDSLKQQIQDKRNRNLKLKKELQAVRSLLNKYNTDSKAANQKQQSTHLLLNEQGLELYREARYEAALEKFIEANKADATFSEAINNVGFVLYKLERYSESVKWLEKTVALEPSRAVAWLNLGDAYYIQEEHDKARHAYKQHFLHNPKSRARKGIEKKLEVIAESETSLFD